MPPCFTIQAYPETDLITIKMAGFFAESDVVAFHEDLRAKLKLLRCGSNQHLTLCNVIEMDIQAGDIVDAFRMVVNNSGTRSRRLAFVAAATLARMQARRLTDRDDVAFFENASDAEAWLSVRKTTPRSGY